MIFVFSPLSRFRGKKRKAGFAFSLLSRFRGERELIAAALLLALSAAGCGRHGQRAAAAPEVGAGIRFTDVAAASGVTFRHTSGQSGRLMFAETMGSGCAMLDYDGDGRLDLFLVNSTRLPGYEGRGPFYSALYRNTGPGPDGFPQFREVTREAGLAVDCYGMGVTVGDYDNDGDPDLYLTVLGPNHLFQNNGDGTFTDVTGRAGVGDPRFSTSAAWLDYDRDGHLDLLVGNYCRWTPETNQLCEDATGQRRMCRPSYYQGQAPVLYRNKGDGTFADITAVAGLGSDVGKTLGIVVWDEDGDGWPDLLLANDGERNRFYLNRPGTGPGGRRFEERALEAGLAYGATGVARAGMGIDSGDYENSGTEAVAVGNFAREGMGFFRPASPGHYVDAAAQFGLFSPSLSFVTFGVLFCDADLDGYRDLIATNGHVEPGDEGTGSGITFLQRSLLFQNVPADQPGRRQFREIGLQAGEPFERPVLGRGMAAGDLDGDGDPDLLVLVNDGPAMLLRNEQTTRRHWLAVLPVGTRSNRDAFGTRIVVTAGGVRQQAWRRSGSSYCSASHVPVLFGLGENDRIDQVELTWPDGKVQTLRDVKAGQILTVKEQEE
jgi:hypothetical protein